MSVPTLARRGALLALALLAGRPDAQFVYLGTASGAGGADSHYGTSVAQLHDVDGDGHAEFLVGSPGDDDVGVDSGSVIVVDGKNGSIVYERHGAAGDELGTSVANLGDVDGDGIDDFAAGRPGRDFNGADAGGVVVYSGADGLILWSKTWSQAGARAGSVVAAAGDVDGDGRGDVLVGAPDWHGPSAVSDAQWGRAVLYSGSNGLSLATITGTSKGDRLGAALAGVSDVSGDGVPDFAIGEPGKEIGSPLSIVNAGTCLVYSGATKALLFGIDGSGGNEACGSAIAPLGDSDLDGKNECVVGRPGWSSQRGRVTVHEGKTGATIATLLGLQETSADAFGSAVSSAGDVNKDGHVDLLVGAPSLGTGVGGYLQVLSGKDWTQYGDVLHSTDVFGSAVDWGFGTTLAAGLDTSTDGWVDALFGMPTCDIGAVDKGFVWGISFTVYQPDYSITDSYQTGNAWLAMYGTELSTGGLADVAVSGAPSSTPVYLLLSLVDALLPFKGGTLVPDPAAAIIVPLLTDANGRVTVANVPGGGGPADLHMQAVMKNPAGPQGWWITNAITAEWLP
ncbi:MAG: FG-GAP repeat protein [Planctomycetes bacterium]|nr:FG-GAP repeat protein [Planctomycetota bacterium]